MRLAAIAIGVLALLISGCSVDPRSKSFLDSKKELAQLKGPDVGSMEDTLKSQAEQASNDGQFARAVQMYKQLTDKYPEKLEYKVGLAENMRRSGDNEGSLKITDEVLKKDPANAAALENKGLCLMNTGEFAEAGKVFGEVMKIDSKRWRTLNGVGILFTMKNLDSDAIAYYQAALDQSTDNPSVLNNIGLTYAMDKQYDKSVDAFERAKRHLPNGSPEIRNIDLNLALVYAIEGKLDEAEHAAAPHLSKAGLYNNMGFYAYLAKNTELAKSYLNMALTQSPVYYERAWKNLGALNGDVPDESNEDATPKGSMFNAQAGQHVLSEPTHIDAADAAAMARDTRGDNNAKDPKDAKESKDSKDSKDAKDSDAAAVPSTASTPAAAVPGSSESPGAGPPVAGVTLDEIPESKPKTPDSKSD